MQAVMVKEKPTESVEALKHVYSHQDLMNDHKWLAANSLDLYKKYQGEWVAIYLGQVIAHHRDYFKVSVAAKEMQVNPLYMEFPEEETIIYAIG